MNLLKYLFIAILTFGFVACSDDEPIEVVVTNPTTQDNSGNSTQTEERFRIDNILLNNAGFNFFGGSSGRVTIDIRSITNEFITNELFFASDGLPQSERQFGVANRSVWRVFSYRSDVDENPTNVREINPWDFKTTDSTFSIPIIEGSGSNLISFTISGAVLEVEI